MNGKPMTACSGFANGFSAAFGLTALAVLATPVLGQEQIENELRHGLRYDLILSAGWEGVAMPTEAYYFTRGESNRMVQIMSRGDAYLDHSFLRGPVTYHTGNFSGHTATIFSASAGMSYMPVRDARIELRGTRQHVHFDSCAVAAYQDGPLTAFAVIITSDDVFTDPMQDAILAPMLETLNITLPEDVQDCPAEMSAALDANPLPQQHDDGVLFTRLGFSLWLPESFGAPAFERSDEIVWLSPGLAETGKGVGVIFGAVPAREIVLGDMSPDDEISRDSIILGAQTFERIHFSMPADEVIGTLYFSREAFHDGNFIALMIATQPDNWDEMRATHDAIAERIESLNGN